MENYCYTRAVMFMLETCYLYKKITFVNHAMVEKKYWKYNLQKTVTYEWNFLQW